jgi:hypothetical protein
LISPISLFYFSFIYNYFSIFYFCKFSFIFRPSYFLAYSHSSKLILSIVFNISINKAIIAFNHLFNHLRDALFLIFWLLRKEFKIFNNPDTVNFNFSSFSIRIFAFIKNISLFITKFVLIRPGLNLFIIVVIFIIVIDWVLALGNSLEFKCSLFSFFLFVSGIPVTVNFLVFQIKFCINRPQIIYMRFRNINQNDLNSKFFCALF